MRTVHALQEALRKALHWQQGFITGNIPSLATLARQEQVDVRQIARFLRLAYLAPDIQEAIFAGEVPLTLTLTTLKRGFPLDWNAQRTQLGFSAT